MAVSERLWRDRIADEIGRMPIRFTKNADEMAMRDAVRRDIALAVRDGDT